MKWFSAFLDPIKWYALIALVIALMAAATGLYVKGRLDASHAAEITMLSMERDQLKRSIALTAQAMQIDEAQAELDAIVIASYEGTVNDLLNALAEPSRECLTTNDVDGLRNLWLGDDRSAAPSTK